MPCRLVDWPCGGNGVRSVLHVIHAVKSIYSCSCAFGPASCSSAIAMYISFPFGYNMYVNYNAIVVAAIAIATAGVELAIAIAKFMSIYRNPNKNRPVMMMSSL